MATDTQLMRLPPRRGKIKARILKSLIMALLQAIHTRNHAAAPSAKTPYPPIRFCSTN